MEEPNSIARPIPTVRLIVTGTGGRVLILRRALNSTGGGQWCLPGGKVDYNDTVEQAAARELEEECGLQAANLRFLFYQDSLPTAPGLMHCVNFYFECQSVGDLKLNAESMEFAWIAPEDLPRYAITFRNDEGLMRYWKEMADG